MDLGLYFWLILRSSLLSTGGYGPLPILHDDFILRGWATERQFTEAIAVGQASPGPNGLWLVSFGYLTAGVPGALLALIGMSIPPLFVLLVERLYSRVGKHIATRGFLSGMSLAIGGIGFVIFARIFVVSGLDLKGLAIFGAVLVLAARTRVPVVALIALAAIAGAVLYA